MSRGQQALSWVSAARVFIIVAILATSVGVLDPVEADEPDEPEVPDWVGLLGDVSSLEPPLPDLEEEPWSAEEISSEPAPAAEYVELPDTAAWDVILGEEGERADVIGAGGPLEIVTAPGAGRAAGQQLRIELLEPEVADEFGIPVFVFTVAEVQGEPSPDLSRG